MKLLKCMQATIRHELSDGVISYEEKPRDQWLFDFPAQVSFVQNRLRIHHVTTNRIVRTERMLKPLLEFRSVFSSFSALNLRTYLYIYLFIHTGCFVWNADLVDD